MSTSLRDVFDELVNRLMCEPICPNNFYFSSHVPLRYWHWYFLICIIIILVLSPHSPDFYLGARVHRGAAAGPGPFPQPGGAPPVLLRRRTGEDLPRVQRIGMQAPLNLHWEVTLVYLSWRGEGCGRVGEWCVIRTISQRKCVTFRWLLIFVPQDVQIKLRDAYKRMGDEFITNRIATQAKVCVLYYTMSWFKCLFQTNKWKWII